MTGKNSRTQSKRRDVFQDIRVAIPTSDSKQKDPLITGGLYSLFKIRDESYGRPTVSRTGLSFLSPKLDSRTKPLSVSSYEKGPSP
jgi:hypothetical protein